MRRCGSFGLPVGRKWLSLRKINSQNLFSSWHERHRLVFVQLFSPVISLARNGNFVLALFPADISQGSYRKLKRFAIFASRNRLKEDYIVAARHTYLSANPSPLFIVSLLIVWWIIRSMSLHFFHNVSWRSMHRIFDVCNKRKSHIHGTE